MSIDNKTKILMALSFSAISLCTFQQQALASDTDVEILNYIEDQRKQAKKDANNVEINQFKKDLDAEYERDNIKITDPKKAPIIFEGNDIMYNSVSGEVYGRGSVKITNNYSRMTTEDAEGNLQSGDVTIPGKSHTIQVENPTIIMDSDKLKYNYNQKTGVMNNAKGRIDRRYVFGEQVEFYPDYYIIYNGSVTRCPAKKPDYALVADKIEVYPDDHLVAYNAKVQIKGHTIYSTKEYVTKIGTNSDGGNTLPPISIRANNEDGVSITYRYRQNLADKVNAYADLKYTSNHDMRNIYGVGWSNAGSSFNIEGGKYEDDDDRWLTKDIAYIYNYGSRIGNSPFSFNLRNEYGKWKEGDIRSWHREHDLSLRHDPIDLTPNGSLKLFPSIGYKLVHEDMDDSNYNSLYYDLTLLSQVNDNLAVYTGYHYSRVSVENTLFSYGLNDYSKKVSAGFSYILDDKNRIVVATGYDASDQLTLRDLDYYWYHDWHCVETELRYQEKKNKWSIHFNFMTF